jgi:4-hydroxybenzoate polyprenyltransferase
VIAPREERGQQSGSATTAFGEIAAMAHPRAVVIFSGLVLVTALIVEQGALPLRLAVALIVARAAIQVAVGIFNDYCDRDLDVIAKPQRALPAGLVKPQTALTTGWLAVVVGLSTAATFGIASVLVLALAGGMGILYSVRLKRTALSWLPYAVAYPMVPVWVWVSLGKFRPESLMIFPVTIPFALGIHLCNQLRDYDEDAAQGMKGLAQHLGKVNAGRLCLGLLFAGPLPALVFSQNKGRGAILLWLAVLSHWLLVARCVTSRGRETMSGTWRPLFRSLQVSSPLILICWLYMTGPSPVGWHM